MRIQYFGTAAAEGWPSPFCHCNACSLARARGGKNIRTRSQALIDKNILIDLPPDFLYHVNNYNIPAGDINYLLITHSHPDHFNPYSLQLRVFPYQSGAAPIEVFCNVDVYNTFLDELQPDMKKYGEYIKFHIIKPFDEFNVENYHIRSLRAEHTKKEDCLIYEITSENKRLLYCHDSGYFPKETWQQIRNIHYDLISLDCTFCFQKSEERHMGIFENIRVKKEMIEIGAADKDTVFVLNHFSHYCAEGLGYEEMQEKALQYGFIISYDGLQIDL